MSHFKHYKRAVPSQEVINHYTQMVRNLRPRQIAICDPRLSYSQVKRMADTIQRMKQFIEWFERNFPISVKELEKEGRLEKVKKS